MWHENGQWLTLLVHFCIALLTTGLYWLMNKRVKAKRKSKNQSNKINKAQ